MSNGVKKFWLYVIRAVETFCILMAGFMLGAIGGILTEVEYTPQMLENMMSFGVGLILFSAFLGALSLCIKNHDKNKRTQ